MATITIAASPGDDLYRIAAEHYGDPEAWTLIARANSLFDPLVQADLVLNIPDYNQPRANGGILASQ
jgi:nucleoid-associated protein YgaU